MVVFGADIIKVSYVKKKKSWSKTELGASSRILSSEVSLGLGGVQVQTHSLLLYPKVKKNQMAGSGGDSRWYTWTYMFRVSSG